MNEDRPDFCEWCGNGYATDPHHQIRRSQGGVNKGVVWLCRMCHNKTEEDEGFYKLIQVFYRSKGRTHDNKRDNYRVD